MEWPGILQHAIFRVEREEIQRLMSPATADDDSFSTPYIQVKNAVTRINSKMRDNLEEFTGTETIAARKFLQALLNTLRNSGGDGRTMLVAANNGSPTE
jgi:hypothetical protein